MSTGITSYKEEILAAVDIVEEQRIFIETKQKYYKVKIGLNTRARDVLNTVAATGQLKGPNSDERAIGGWMVYEVANEFGMGASTTCHASRLHRRHEGCPFLPRSIRTPYSGIRTYLRCAHRVE
jgi:hypothetical protein